MKTDTMWILKDKKDTLYGVFDYWGYISAEKRLIELGVKPGDMSATECPLNVILTVPQEGEA